MFLDPEYPEQRHGVVAFLIPQGYNLNKLDRDLWGPFGYSSSIDVGGQHLYGRDTWGTVKKEQLPFNPELQALAALHPDMNILLAGVRHLKGWHIWPLNKADKFVMVENRE